MKLQTRAFLLFAAVIVLICGLLYAWVATDLESRLISRASAELERTARLAALTIDNRQFTDSLADSLGATLDLRVTLMAPDGTVLGDSEVPENRLPAVENHASRPEMREALRDRVGSARRASGTVARSLLYVAVPHPGGVVRVAEDLANVTTPILRTRRILVVAAGLALALGFMASVRVGAAIRVRLCEIRRVVDALGDGDLEPRVSMPEDGEVARLRKAIDLMAERVGTRIEGLETARNDLDALFRNLDDGLAVIDREGTVLLANRTFERWTGQSDVVGRRFASLFRAPQLAEAMKHGLEGRYETEEVTLGDRTVLVSVQPHRGGALVVIRDLTRLRQLEGVRRDFVANVSHELKTPLTSIVGFAEAISEGELTSEQNTEFGGRILYNAMRMRRLVDDLLDLALVESGSWTPQREPLQVAEVASRVWSSLAALPGHERVTIEVEDDSGETAYADREGVSQVFKNLFDNALRYAPEGSAVRVRVRPEGVMLRIEVIDSGPGIASTHLPRVFERFYRVDPARSRAAGGTGLGLSIVKHLVAAHGGEVGIESEVGRGTTVWFTLPIAAESAAEPTEDASV